MTTRKKHLAQAARLADDPKFLYHVGKKLRELALVGDIRSGLIVFLATLTMYIDEKVSILVAGPSSSGKSTRIEKPIMLFPTESVIRRASLSRKAIVFGEGSLDKKALYINEYRGGREAQLLLRIAQSDGTIAHEYAQGGKTHVVHRLGSPVVLTTSSEKEVLEDDSTRFLTINIEQTPDQILAVLKASIGCKAKSHEPNLKVYRQAIRLIGSKAEKPFDFPSWIEFVAEQVPREKPRSMRDWKRFLALLKIISLCRSQLESRNEISFADYCVAYQILNPAFTATLHAVHESELVVKQAVSTLNKELRRPVTAKEIGVHLGWNEGRTYKYVRIAIRHALIRPEGQTLEKNVKRFVPVVGAAKTFLPQPKRILRHVSGLGNCVEYIDPFTGARRRIYARRPHVTKGLNELESKKNKGRNVNEG